MLEIIGKKVVAVKRYPKSRTDSADYILFDDGETYMVFDEQDYYTYHDCSSSAREVTVYQDKDSWNIIMTYPDTKEK